MQKIYPHKQNIMPKPSIHEAFAWAIAGVIIIVPVIVLAFYGGVHAPWLH